ncbi:MAG: PP2C family protein-serine/threonine phosphatase [Planctomycetota bacterium]
MNPQSISLHEPKNLYRMLDRLFGAIDHALSQERLVESFFEQLVNLTGAHLRFTRAVLYMEGREVWVPLAQLGEGPAAPELPLEVPCISLVLTHLVYIFADPDQPDSPHRGGALPRAASAAIVVGRKPQRYVLMFALGDGWVREELDFVLNTVRVALGSRMIDQRVRGTFLEAAEIQQSLLLEHPPRFPGYDIACRSIPAEEVGGDFYDFTSFEGDILGLSIGDASGHGLPAALLVRDVVIGMRMGLEKNLKMGYALAKLNGVIHRSTLSSCFVSMFYGELERNGNLLYVNAGHQPPLLFLQDRIVELATGDTVIGPLPDVQYKRSFAHVDRGATLLLVTDGLVERRSPAGDLFGVERIKQVVGDGPREAAALVLDRLFAAAHAFGDGAPWEDDATAVVVTRRSGA